MPSKKPATATTRVMMVLFLMIQSVPISSTTAVTRVSSRQNYPGTKTTQFTFSMVPYRESTALRGFQRFLT